MSNDRRASGNATPRRRERQRHLDPYAYNPAKAAQVIAYFVLKAGGGAMHVVKAMKLVYLADRDSIARWGAPILNEPRASLKHGPVNMLTYDHVNGKARDEYWSRVLAERGCGNKDVVILQGVTLEDLDQLSEADRISMDSVWQEFGFMKPFALRGWTHKEGNIPEWSAPGLRGSKPIPLADIMREVGVPSPDRAAQKIDPRHSSQARGG